MTAIPVNEPGSIMPSARNSRTVLLAFAGALFLSAFLLFSVQPFFTKLMLPRLGGTPAVWSVAMVFFQAMLLLGYLYAHALNKLLSVRVAAVLHLLVMASAFMYLPIAISAAWNTPPETGQATWMLGMLLASVGLPFFALSANGPLLQAWFSRSGHPQADDPYFLYGASNIGSFASLLLYIIAIEPALTLSQQGFSWTVGFGLLAAMIAICALLVGNVRPVEMSATQASSSDRGVAQVLSWIVLGLVPSGLLVAVTAHISTDVAAAPFLWVLPLGLFLLTFVFAFRSVPLISLRWLELAAPILGATILVSFIIKLPVSQWVLLALHLVFYFVAALYCHSILYQRRPSADRLTGFYLAMSFGGVIGGAFASLLAPVMFSWIAEYPILIVSVLMVPIFGSEGKRSLVMVGLGIAAASVASVALVSALDQQMAIKALMMALLVLAAISLIFLFRSRPAYLVAIGAILPLLFAFNAVNQGLLRERSFFGVSKVARNEEGYNLLYHGTTIHGAEQAVNADGSAVIGKPTPLTYYHHNGTIAATLLRTQSRAPADGFKSGIVGLGTGAMACYARPGEDWKFFEIDKTMVDLARKPSLFRFMTDCGAAMPVVVGDARLTLADELDQSYDYLLIDAFSSDSIPTHLLTVEAVDLFMRKVKPNGLLAFHISNRYMELPSVVSAIGEKLGVPVRIGAYNADPAVLGSSRSIVAVLTKNADDLAFFDKDPRWVNLAPEGVSAWTDDYSNILAALFRPSREPNRSSATK